jgi:2-polyprenyl-6-methoxyphenol hydroxylase-like FAD-dependent oxidoreductase
MLLARRGHRVLVVDRARYGSDTPSTHALMKGAVVQLHRWGLLDRVAASGAPVIRQTTFDYGDERVTVDIRPAAGVDGLYAPRRTVLDPILVDAAVDGGADVRFGVSLADVVTDGCGAVVGVELDEDGRRELVGCDLVVGADGSRSRVAQATGSLAYRLGTSAGAMVYTYFGLADLQGYEWYYGDQASAGAIPTNDGTLVWTGTTQERFDACVRPDFESGFWTELGSVAAPLAARLDGVSRTSRWHSTRGQVGYHRQSFGPGWALVGDAAHLQDPITAHGLTDALRDAELLARAVDVALRCEDRMSHALAMYQATRDQLSHRIFALTDRIAGYRWTGAELRELLLAFSGAMRDEVAAIERLDLPSAA